MKDRLILLSFLNIFFASYMMITNSSNYYFKNRYMSKEGFKLTTYGFIAGITFLFVSLIGVGAKLSIKKITIIFIIYFILSHTICEACRNDYRLIASYFTLLPIAGLLLTCRELSVFVLCFALWTAFTRYACLAAGCCTGDVIKDTQNPPSFYTIYSDPEQLINKKNNTQKTMTYPITLIEIILQSIIVLMILQQPKYTIQIFSILLIFGSGSVVKIFMALAPGNV